MIFVAVRIDGAPQLGHYGPEGAQGAFKFRVVRERAKMGKVGGGETHFDFRPLQLSKHLLGVLRSHARFPFCELVGLAADKV